MATTSPKDKYLAVWVIFFMLGLGTLLPWNFFMTATMYFRNRLKDPLPTEVSANQTEAAGQHQSVLQTKFNNVMTLCAMLPLLLCTCLTSFLHALVPQRLRVMGSLFIIMFVFIITAVLVKVPLEPLPFFSITMVKIIIINSFGAVLQGSLFGMAGLLPASYTTPIMSGQGLAGTFAATSMICAIASGSELEDAAFGYFIVACVVIFLSILSYVLLPKLTFFQFYQERNRKQRSDDEQNAVTLMNAENKDAAADEKQQSISMMKIFQKIWILASSVCFIFTVTIGTFPAITADTRSTLADGGTWERYFVPVSCFLLFNLSDWTGRSLTAVCMWVKTAGCCRRPSWLALSSYLSSCCATFSPASICPSSSITTASSSPSCSSSPSATATWPASACATDRRTSFLTKQKPLEPSWRSSWLWDWLPEPPSPSCSEHWSDWDPVLV
ncbi:equilibrative nucleoside transporter 1-like isoform X1 [Xiphophorus hellerii]|uniref:equilibrative nucleoside transporter 1-like isoform X1 n=1 Tax=Xiphophorus hellerii TaxID=8084 RepID=UPI0013B3A093|nr:equilibrative nucleoside transporter 1-like isoform X1 [Xiphophorus hellerii]